MKSAPLVREDCLLKVRFLRLSVIVVIYSRQWQRLEERPYIWARLVGLLGLCASKNERGTIPECVQEGEFVDDIGRESGGEDR